MTLKRIVVKNLFGELNHDIPIHYQEGLTLLHGPNGTGKTSVLRIIDFLFNQKLLRLCRIPVEKLEVSFADDSRLEVSWAEPSNADRPGRLSQKDLAFRLHAPSKRAKTWTYSPDSGRRMPYSLLEEVIPELIRVGLHTYRDVRSDRIIEFEEALDIYADRLPRSIFSSSKNSGKAPEWLTGLLASNPVYLIETQRLEAIAPGSQRARRGPEETEKVPTVSLYGDDLAGRIRNTLADYAEYSQSLDSTFPNRLLREQVNAQDPSDNEIRNRYSAQAARRKKYVEIGLIDAGDALLLPSNLDEAALRVLNTYLDDIDQKLDRLDDLAGRLQLFLDIVNGKLRRVSIEVSRDNGIIARAKRDNSEINLSSLSSGEQQEVVMAYGLLFREQPGTLVLIDEPELSLHVGWQLDFIPDLLRVAQVAKLDFLAATHSPQIINDRWDLAVALSDGV